MVSPDLLARAGVALGARTYSETVRRALEEAVRVAEVRGLLELVGTDAWTGDLARMREDRVPARRARRRS